MKAKKVFIFLLYFLFVLFSEGFGSVISYKQNERSFSEFKQGISQNVTDNDKESIAEINSILELIIKVKENDSSRFQNYKNNKKRFNTSLVLKSSLFSKLQYTFYCSTRLNRITSFPLYITHRRLII